MEKMYFLDAYHYICPKCHRPVSGKKYYAVFAMPEIGAAKAAGLIEWACTHPDCGFSSGRILVNGRLEDASKEEALANGLAFESKGLA